MKLEYFGTDGIRGEYGGDLLNDSLAYCAGRAAAEFVRARGGAAAPRLLIGRDTRASGAALQEALAAGFVSCGGTVAVLGVAPTPVIAYAAANSSADIACSITASHNPHQDNGIKFFSRLGSKLSEAEEAALDAEVARQMNLPKPDNWPQASFEEASSEIEGYVHAIGDAFGADLLRGKQVALDCANGATCDLAPSLFESLGAEVVAIGTAPDGRNINKKAGSEYPESLGALMRGQHFDFGFAFDGDGDRVIVFNGSGTPLPGEAVMVAVALFLKDKSELPGDTLVTTIQSNLGLDHALSKQGISVKRVDIGDKHVARCMQAEGFRFGSEESGHYIVGSFSPTGDGICAALTAARVAIDNPAVIQDWKTAYQAFPKRSEALRVPEKLPLESCAALQSEMQRLEGELADQGRLLVRYSGTEPKLRLLVEARDQNSADAGIEALLSAARSDLLSE